MHASQLDIDVDLVTSLITDQFPQWSGLPVHHAVPAGSVNAIFRVGDSLAVRLPLEEGDVHVVREWLAREVRAGAEFGEVSPVPVPEHIAWGAPGCGYPLPWVVQSWLAGHDAIAEDPAASVPFALELSTLLSSLRAADTRGRCFSGSGRGGHLPDHDEWMTHCFAQSDGLVDVKRLRAMWQALRLLPQIDADVMCHGDLTPQNVLVEAGHLVGVLDCGGYAAADPALDLVAVWHLLDHDRRELVRQQLQCSDVQWQRGMAWSLQQAMGLVWYYVDTNPVMSRWGMRTLDRLLAASES